MRVAVTGACSYSGAVAGMLGALGWVLGVWDYDIDSMIQGHVKGFCNGYNGPILYNIHACSEDILHI